ncbi:MAG: gas vesicle protein GvpN [Nanoarchaeota archaeon]|nr:gas vesicle protein GvpN [Nanoarchaeota archaeon]
MVYVSEHQRKVRGGQSAHLTFEEKQELVSEEKEEEEKSVSLQDIEAQFLTPKTKNFVETDAVKEYEKRVEVWLKAGYPVHVIGPTGCGKTALALRVAEKLKRPSMWINGDEAITTNDLVGGYSKIEMMSVRDKYIHNVYKDKDVIEPMWVSNPLTLSCKHGYTLIYNEFSRAKPEANNILLGILEEGVLELPTKFGEERYVKVNPGFNLILTSNNIDYAGVHKPQDALLDRLACIHMDYYDRDTEIKIVMAHSNVSQSEAEVIVNLIRGLRKKLQGAEKPGTRPAIMIAQAMGNGYKKELFEQICIDAIASKFEDPIKVSQKADLIRNQLKTVKIA